ncbi:MAG: hypothetical protein ACM3N5_09410, partial [Candidatus Eiseniibacteriota bacterium]
SRWTRSGGPLHGIIPAAVDEVGGPTILATFTVIAALLPMAFVTGLMGPYMSPIPINASMTWSPRAMSCRRSCCCRSPGGSAFRAAASAG